MTPADLAKTGTEHAHQSALFAWLNMAAHCGFDAAWNDEAYKNREVAQSLMKPVPPDAIHPANLFLAFAIPNGGERNKIVASKLKAEGVKSGVPDIFIPVAVGNWHGLFVELKKIGGKASPEQIDWIIQLRHQGYRAYIVEGWVAAAHAIQRYVEGNDL